MLALAARAQPVHLVLGQVQDRFHHVFTVAVRGLNKWNFHKRPIFYFLQKSNSDVRSENPKVKTLEFFSTDEGGGALLTFQHVYIF